MIRIIESELDERTFYNRYLQNSISKGIAIFNFDKIISYKIPISTNDINFGKTEQFVCKYKYFKTLLEQWNVRKMVVCFDKCDYYIRKKYLEVCNIRIVDSYIPENPDKHVRCYLYCER